MIALNMDHQALFEREGFLNQLDLAQFCFALDFFSLVSPSAINVSMRHSPVSLFTSPFFDVPKLYGSVLVLSHELHLFFAVNASLSLSLNCSQSKEYRHIL